MNLFTSSKKSLYFIGIGGIGMSGIAEVLHNIGYCVQGSDVSNNANVQRLKDLGITVIDSHDTHTIDDAQVVVVSSAINPNNPELLRAKELKIPVIKRAEMLAELMRLKMSVAISGTHGKTTTTSMAAFLLDYAGLDPTVVNGGIINSYGSNARLGTSKWIVVEADESDGSFVNLLPTIAVITNINKDHLDFYRDFDHIKESFNTFIHKIPFYGLAIICIDNPNSKELADQLTDRRVITYGFSESAQVRAVNLRKTSNGTCFDVVISDYCAIGSQWHNNIITFPKVIKDLFLPVVGEHNVQNALAIVSLAQELQISDSVLKTALSNFENVKRRFTLTGSFKQANIYDDYAHHPHEIQTTLKAAQQMATNNIIAVCQPHRYSRLNALMDEFVKSFDLADQIVLCPTYSAGEKPIEGATHEALAEKIKALHPYKPVYTVQNYDELVQTLDQITQEADVVLCLGAGNISEWAWNVPKHPLAITPAIPPLASHKKDSMNATSSC